MLKAPTNLRNMIFVRLPDDTWEWLRHAADAQELAISTLARKLIKQAAQQDQQQKGRKDGRQD
jgi:hypothetical protein